MRGAWLIFLSANIGGGLSTVTVAARAWRFVAQTVRLPFVRVVVDEWHGRMVVLLFFPKVRAWMLHSSMSKPA